MRGCRDDILFALSVLSRLSLTPSHYDMLALDRLILYLIGSKSIGRCFQSNEGIKLYCSVDASYATHKDMKSHSGVSLRIGDKSGAFKSSSTKQTITADASTISELIASYTAAKATSAARNFLAQIGFPQVDATNVDEDNMATIKVVNSHNSTKHTRHVDIKYNLVRDMVKQNILKFRYVPTDEMIADMLTKALGPTKFKYLRSKLLGMLCQVDSNVLFALSSICIFI